MGVEIKIFVLVLLLNGSTGNKEQFIFPFTSSIERGEVAGCRGWGGREYDGVQVTNEPSGTFIELDLLRFLFRMKDHFMFIFKLACGTIYRETQRAYSMNGFF